MIANETVENGTRKFNKKYCGTMENETKKFNRKLIKIFFSKNI
jgi:hypothetical protein